MRFSFRETSLVPIWIIPGLGIAAELITFVICHLLTPWYRSDTTLFFPNAMQSGAQSLLSRIGGEHVLGASGASSQVPLLGGLVSSPLIGTGPDVAIAVLSSARAKNIVMKQLDLPKVWHMNAGAAWKRLRTHVSFKIDENGLLDVAAEDTNPHRASIIAKSFVQTFQKLSNVLSLNVAHRNRVFLEGRLRLARERNKTLRERLLDIEEMAPSTLMTMSSSNSDLAKMVSNLETQYTQAKITDASINAQLKWSTGAAWNTVNSINALPSAEPFAKHERAQVQELEGEVALAGASFGPDNPQYRQLKVQLDIARKQLRAEAIREAHALKLNIAPEVAALYAKKVEADAETAGMSKVVDKLKNELSKLPAWKIKEEQIQHELQANENLTELLATQTELARIAEARDATSFVTIDKPGLPTAPYSPRTLFDTVAAGFIGIIIGFGAFMAGRALVDSESLTDIKSDSDTPSRMNDKITP